MWNLSAVGDAGDCGCQPSSPSVIQMFNHHLRSGVGGPPALGRKQ